MLKIHKNFLLIWLIPLSIFIVLVLLQIFEIYVTYIMFIYMLIYVIWGVILIKYTYLKEMIKQ